MTDIIYNKILVVEFLLCLFSTIGVILNILLYEFRDQNIDDETFVNLLLMYNFICSVSLATGIYFRYDLYRVWFVARGLLTEEHTLITSAWWKPLVIEQALMMIAPLPFLQHVTYDEYNDAYKVTITYAINDILLCFSLLRAYLLIRFTLVAS